MKKTLIILATIALAFPALAEQTNEYRRSKDERKGERKYREYREMTPEQKAEMDERRVQLMEKTLAEIGVSEEQQAQIAELQANLKTQMRESSMLLDECRKNLSELEKIGAAEGEVYAAIDAVADAQAEQMKILARNRIQMERILGKEKFSQFMDCARSKWHEHGRRRKEQVPPQPGVPPLPNQNKQITPPMP
ncbi:hypothetical protein P4E94_06830 [Pontiellaceae bacterium B12219]|nr:hypothetical protein [Pontiellaceae bacterium B12219]